MTLLALLLAIVLKLAGIVFLFAAAVGIWRFSDPFQRMHAATKAGTLGAGLVVLGTIVGMGRTDVAIIGTATIVFLLITIPIAGHLLGRAAYVSGAPMTGLRGEDALAGHLDRSEVPLEERLNSEPVEWPVRTDERKPADLYNRTPRA